MRAAEEHKNAGLADSEPTEASGLSLADDPAEDREQNAPPTPVEIEVDLPAEHLTVPAPNEGAEFGRELEAFRVECAELREQLLRRKAEFDNYRRRVERDRQVATDDARAEVIREFLPALDNLERALRAEGDERSVRDGVEMILGELGKALARLGVRSEEPVGERFDPLSQQALLYEIVPGFADGTIVEVYRRSYHLGDQLLRPAMVKVAKGDEPGEGGSQDEPVH